MVTMVVAVVVARGPMVVFLIHLSFVSSLFIFYLLEMLILIRGIISETNCIGRRVQKSFPLANVHTHIHTVTWMHEESERDRERERQHTHI